MQSLMVFTLLALWPVLAVAQVNPIKPLDRPAALSTAPLRGAADPSNQKIIPLSELGKPLLLGDRDRKLLTEPHSQQPKKNSIGAANGDTTAALERLSRTPLYHKYVNFEVVKLMVGSSWGAPDPIGNPYPWSLVNAITANSGDSIEQKRSASTRIQVLCPYPLSRHLQIAYGITYASSRLAFGHAKFDFEKNPENRLKQDATVRSTTVLTRGIGLVLLRVTRLPGRFRDVTLLTGLSGEYNFATQLRTRQEDGQVSFVSRREANKYVHRLSVPVHVQVGWAPYQFWSVGGFVSYDLIPRFSAGEFRDIKGRDMRQVVAGISLGIII